MNRKEKSLNTSKRIFRKYLKNYSYRNTKGVAFLENSRACLSVWLKVSTYTVENREIEAVS